ncbi:MULTISPECIES: carboxymuconolactone decarboxylase family protein [unclassified Streptomyces]|uniref:carboxymuconolactone decarboxylase family protein n=1 Tax=unclassified Streptomyces TaxID=2593676 RepID=UPI002DDB6098|nr:carboxymuconolactone decarboxylase family protein [Streptomyces sp. NBC_01237]WRZ78504.1 carboxymuconolactone decarboxylase family protein [Streptomyces sp. NBC_01237]
MTDDILASRTEAIRDRYRSTLGTVPGGVQERLRLAQEFGRLPTEEAIAALRHIVLTDNPLGARVQQLVHYGQLLALGRAHPARIHAQGALHAGAGIADLIGVAETALITAGVPAYALGTEITAELLPHKNDGEVRPSDRAGGPVRL